MDLSILIVNYNGAKLLPDCLNSVLKSKFSGSYEVLVIDNGSEDDSLQVLSAYESKIKLIPNTKNLGFSKGNNVLAKHAQGKYLYLLNNDTISQQDNLEVLYSFLNHRSFVGAVAPKLLNSDGSLQLPGSSLGHFRFKSTVPRSVPFILGAAVMIKKSLYEEIGGLDENYFFYNDDVDLCKTLLKKGYAIYYVPTTALTHIGGVATKTRKIGSLIEGYRGGLYLCKKHYGSFIYSIYRVLVLFDVIPKILFYLILFWVSQEKRSFLFGYFRILKIILFNQIYWEKKNVD
jgi:hypothetical protein